jgi:hypothetical protein
VAHQPHPLSKAALRPLSLCFVQNRRGQRLTDGGRGAVDDKWPLSQQRVPLSSRRFAMTGRTFCDVDCLQWYSTATVSDNDKNAHTYVCTEGAGHIVPGVQHVAPQCVCMCVCVWSAGSATTPAGMTSNTQTGLSRWNFSQRATDPRGARISTSSGSAPTCNIFLCMCGWVDAPSTGTCPEVCMYRAHRTRTPPRIN